MNLASTIVLNETLASNLRRLMQTHRINECALSRQTTIPQPTLHKILSGKTNDPRASTLKSLAAYFKVSIEELLYGTPTTKSQNSSVQTQLIAVISWSDCINVQKSIDEHTPTHWNKWIVSEFLSNKAFALTSKASMDARFPKGTIFIVDPTGTAEDGDLVIVHFPNTSEATIRELSVDGPSKFLLPICPNSSICTLDDNINILGIVRQTRFFFEKKI